MKESVACSEPTNLRIGRRTGIGPHWTREIRYLENQWSYILRWEIRLQLFAKFGSVFSTKELLGSLVRLSIRMRHLTKSDLPFDPSFGTVRFAGLLCLLVSTLPESCGSGRMTGWLVASGGLLSVVIWKTGLHDADRLLESVTELVLRDRPRCVVGDSRMEQKLMLRSQTRRIVDFCKLGCFCLRRASPRLGHREHSSWYPG